jgi:hypothetical protein
MDGGFKQFDIICQIGDLRRWVIMRNRKYGYLVHSLGEKRYVQQYSKPYVDTNFVKVGRMGVNGMRKNRHARG